MLIKQVSILLVDLLLLSLNIFLALFIDLTQNTEQHLVTLLLIIDLCLLRCLHIVKVFQL